MTSLLGHEAAWAAWRAARRGGRMHHAWLLAGREGLGKGAFARAAAAELIAEPGVAQPLPGAHPDLIVLEPLPANDDEAKKAAEGKPYLTRRNIAIDQVRAMQRRLITRPTLGARRAVVIDAADDLEKGAVNALLKSLEEPPAGTTFVLIAHRPGRLLPTVRSRCQTLRFAPLAADAMAEALASALPGADAPTRAAALALAGGAPGAAIAFATPQLATLHRLFERLLREDDADLAIRGELAAALGARPDRETLLVAIEAARRTLIAHLPGVPITTQLRIADAHDALVRLAAQAPTHNFEPALLLMEIGGLLAAVAPSRENSR